MIFGEIVTLAGALLILVSAIGVLRFKDALARMHALSKGSTLGILLVLAGVAFNLDNVNDITSVVLAAVLVVIAAPPASNMVSRAVYVSGGMRHDPDTIDEGAEPLGISE